MLARWHAAGDTASSNAAVRHLLDAGFTFTSQPLVVKSPATQLLAKRHEPSEKDLDAIVYLIWQYGYDYS